MNYHFVRKTMNNGYGDTEQGYRLDTVSEEDVKTLWLGGLEDEALDDFCDDHVFNWNVYGDEGQRNWDRLQKDGFIVYETEDGELMGLGVDLPQVISEVLKNV